MSFTPEKATSMNVFEAVDSRIACRAFFDKPVDPDIVKDLLARRPAAICNPGTSMR
jgi:hypothetical protein